MNRNKYVISLILATILFSSFFYAYDLFAQEEGEGEGARVYIIYRDTNGKMAKIPPQAVINGDLTGVSFGATGHVGFLIVEPDGSS